MTMQPALGMERKLGAGELSIGYEKNLQFLAVLNFSGTQRGSANFGAKVGCVLLNQHFTISGGCMYQYKSSDKTEYTVGDNFWQPMISFQLEQKNIFLETNIFTNKWQILLGYKMKGERKRRYY